MSSTGSGWTTLDKVAGVVALGLMGGYYVAPVGSTVAHALHLVLEPLATLLPFSVLLLFLSGTTGLYSAVLGYWLRDNERLERVRERMEALRERMEAAREGDDAELDELRDQQQAVLRDYIGAMKTQFRPAVWSMLLTVPVFLWIRWAMMTPSVAIAPVAFALPLVGHVAWTATLVGPVKFWVVWYLGGSLSSTLVARRLLKRVHG